MKKFLLFCYAVATLQGFSGCSPSQPKEDYGWLKNAIDTSVQQLEETVADVGDSVLMPRSIWTGYDMDFLCSQLQREPVGRRFSHVATYQLDGIRYGFSL